MPDESTTEVSDYRHGRVPRPVRERQILALGAALFAERGYAGTSMEEIARRSGLSRPVVYDLAGSKAHLFVRVLEAALDDIATELTAVLTSEETTDTDIWQSFRRAVAAFFRFGNANPAEFSLVISAGGGDPELDQQLQALRSRSNQHLTDLFAEVARQTGIDVPHDHLQALAHATQGACDYFARWRLTETPDMTPESAADMVADLLEPGLRSLLGSAQDHS